MTDRPRYVWLREDGHTYGAKVLDKDWGSDTMINRLQLADGTHRASVPFYGWEIPPASGTVAFLSRPLPDGNAFDEAVAAGRQLLAANDPGGGDDEPREREPTPPGHDHDPPGHGSGHDHGPGHTPGTDPQPAHGSDSQHGHNQGGKGQDDGHSDPQPAYGKDGSRGHKAG